VSKDQFLGKMAPHSTSIRVLGAVRGGEKNPGILDEEQCDGTLTRTGRSQQTDGGGGVTWKKGGEFDGSKINGILGGEKGLSGWQKKKRKALKGGGGLLQGSRGGSEERFEREGVCRPGFNHQTGEGRQTRKGQTKMTTEGRTTCPGRAEEGT